MKTRLERSLLTNLVNTAQFVLYAQPSRQLLSDFTVIFSSSEYALQAWTGPTLKWTAATAEFDLQPNLRNVRFFTLRLSSAGGH